MKRTKLTIGTDRSGDYYSAEYVTESEDKFTFEWYVRSPYIHIFVGDSDLASDLINVYDYEQGKPKIDNIEAFTQAIDAWIVWNMVMGDN